MTSVNSRLSISSMVRSAPAQNVSLPEVMTAPLIAASPATFSMMLASSSITLRSMTFIERPGESQVTSAMPSASVSSLKWTMCMAQGSCGYGSPDLCRKRAPFSSRSRTRSTSG